MLSNNDRTFGIEIEFTANGNDRDTIVEGLKNAGLDVYFAGYTHAVSTQWKLVTDASVMGGFELVSPILKGTDGIEQLRKACEGLKALRCGANRSCGLHIHHDIRSESEQTVLNLFKSYAKSEEGIDSMLPASRRGNGAQYVRTLAGRGINAASSMTALRSRIGTRYVKLNIESYWRQGTVEFRHHSGTVEFEKISNWVYLTQRMIERAKSGEFGDRNLRTMLNNLYGNVVAAPRSIMNRGIAKVARTCFELGITDRATVLAQIKSIYPNAKTNLRRVTSYYKMWSENNSTAAVDSSDAENNPVVEYALARAAHFNAA